MSISLAYKSTCYRALILKISPLYHQFKQFCQFLLLIFGKFIKFCLNVIFIQMAVGVTQENDMLV